MSENTAAPQPPILHLRIPETLDEQIRQWAVYHGRTKSEEVRQALAVHFAQSVLAALQRPEAELEFGDDLAAAKADAKAEVARRIKETYRRPTIDYSAN